MAEQYSIVYLYHNYFIHSSVDGHLGYFHVLDIVDSVAVNNGYMYLFQFWFLQGICQVWGLLGQVVVLFLVFKETLCHLSKWMYQFTFPPTVQEHSLFSTPTPAFIFCRLFDDGHSNWCQLIAHCSFDLRFSNNEKFWASVHVFVSHLYVFFGEMSV